MLRCDCCGFFLVGCCCGWLTLRVLRLSFVVCGCVFSIAAVCWLFVVCCLLFVVCCVVCCCLFVVVWCCMSLLMLPVDKYCLLGLAVASCLLFVLSGVVCCLCVAAVC